MLAAIMDRYRMTIAFAPSAALKQRERPTELGPFVRERISDRARAIRIEVRSGGEVHLVIPRSASRQEARKFLANRSGWVQQRLIEMQGRENGLLTPRPLCWDGRDRLPVCGKALPLRWEPASINGCVVRIDTRKIGIFSRPHVPQRARYEALVEAFRELARTEFSRCLGDEADALGVDYKQLRIGDPRSRWGSCSFAGVISLSWRLIMAPRSVQRYVAVHELCHRRHFNHSERFWRLLSTRMPEYAIQRAWLRDYGICLNTVLPR